MFQAAECLGLHKEPASGFAFPSEWKLHRFYRCIPLQCGMMSAVHGAHASLSQLANQLIFPKPAVLWAVQDKISRNATHEANDTDVPLRDRLSAVRTRAVFLYRG